VFGRRKAEISRGCSANAAAFSTFYNDRENRGRFGIMRRFAMISDRP
jgi:hypothetical protein